MADNNRNGTMTYSLGGALLISLVTEVVTANHYWKTLSGIALVACVGILFVFWTQIWTTAWAIMETQDKGVNRVAYVATLFVTMSMILNSGFILATRNKENLDDTKARQEKSKIEDLKGLDPSVARELLRQKGATDQREAEERRRERTMSDTGRKEETSMKDIAEGYMSFFVFIVPFAVAALSKFVVLAMIALPGGATGYLPTRQSAQATGSAPTPAGASPNPPTPIQSPRATVPISRDGGGNRPNA